MAARTPSFLNIVAAAIREVLVVMDMILLAGMAVGFIVVASILLFVTIAIGVTIAIAKGVVIISILLPLAIVVLIVSFISTIHKSLLKIY